MTRGPLAVAALVFACFAAFALWRSPVPGVNEPQYLCKAKHFYAPEWCARDMFLNSANAHWVFYALAGAVTRIASLDQTAWIGRLLVWTGLAYAWLRLVWMLVPGRYAPLWSACLFLALQAMRNLSGEWLVGGVEAKGFSYVALLLAIVAACEESYRRAAIATGIAISLHPIVGIWGGVSLMAATAGRSLFTPLSSLFTVPFRAWIRRTYRTLAIPGLLCLIFALPGLIPALAMMARIPSRGDARRADVIQVFERLDHHLDPAEFSKSSYLMYAGLLAAWLAMTFIGDRTTRQRFFTRFVLATLAITLAGLVVGLWWRNPALMKFYPFRLFDVFLPIAVSISAVGLLERVGPASVKAGEPLRSSLTWITGPGLGFVALGVAFLAPGRDPNPSNMQYQQNWLAFIEACRWIERNTPQDALFLTMRSNVGFKWYAERAEYVTWKDCPQNAAGILEWNDRLELIDKWRVQFGNDGYTRPEFAVLSKRTGIDHVLTWNTESWHIRPIYQNRAFSVYRLAK